MMMVFRMLENIPSIRYSSISNVYCVSGVPGLSLLIQSTDYDFFCIIPIKKDTIV